ncbi:hypothetical protein K461DRAFT_294158 [Myriangium duriaei CBS 260.36]|uniref:Zn(2)-C6 fungal-type domain-containing protein n=1 Tax=Myriangium duriaei CBS 260.36 TaxID=1168546 RepID=A0A9P4IZ13_9PEZI|nr:hypothetical protein K461DRAFT_294158 [Myriangium duriaei CBS 260.36]
MSSYPPPPQPDQQHYNPIYAAGTSSQPLLDPVQHEHLHFANQLSQSTGYPKVEHEGLDPTTSSQIEQRIEQLQHQQSLQSLDHDHLQPPDLEPPHDAQLPPLPDHHGQQPSSTPQKLFRLRKACDSCSIRKVKCDESGPPCKACAALDIPCTFDRPSRRRGPPNRHAEAIKRRRIDDDPVPGPSMPSSPTHAAQALAALSSHPTAPSQLSAESILPVDIINLLINDYFTYIHPLCPFPHEPSFREAWRERQDYTHRPFLALLASMIAALVASFPRKPQLYLKAQHREKIYSTPSELVTTCFKVCAAARGPGYLDSQTLSVHDAATSYLLGLAGTYTQRWRQGRLYFGECLTIIKALDLHKAKDNNYFGLNGLTIYNSEVNDQDGNKEEMLDNITLQVGRRVFWTAFVSTRSISQLGASWGELYIPPSTPTDPYPPLPMEVEDHCIFPTHIESQPPGLTPNIAGFNANVRVFLSYQQMSVMEMAWGIDHVVDWDRQKNIYYDCLLAAKRVLDQLPEEFKLVFKSDANDSSSTDPLAAFQLKMGLRDTNLLGMDGPDPSAEQRRAMQREIQKANIYASGLATLSFIVEKFWSAHEAQNKRNGGVDESEANQLSPDSLTRKKLERLLPPLAPSSGDVDIEGEMATERDSIIRNLLVVLSTIDRENMEPNGDSFAHKIRFIASTLVDVPRERKGALALQAEDYLKAFLDILVRLERAKADADSAGTGDEGHNGAGGGNMPGGVGDEDAEARHWDALREYQAKFAQSGGVAGFS